MGTTMVFHPYKVRLFQRSDQPSNYWFMRVFVEGKQYRRSLKTCHLESAKQEATNFMVDLLAKQKAGQKVFSTTLKQFRDAFHLDLQRSVVRGERSKLTTKNIGIRIDRGLEFLKSKSITGSAAVDSVEGKMWQSYIDWRLQQSPMRRDGIETELVSIRSAFEWARKQGWCSDRNVPEWDLQTEKSRAVRDKLSHQDFSKVRKLMQHWAAQATPKQKASREMVLAVFMTIWSTGLRTGEALKLTRKDIEVGRDEIIITVRAETTKVRKRRQVPLLHSGGLWLRKWLSDYRPDLQPDDLVFAVFKTKNCSTLFYRMFSRFRQEVLKPEGLEHAEAYHGRHQFITERLQAGEPIHLIGKLCGTSTREIERTYSGVIDVVIGREFAKRKIHYNEEDGSFAIVDRTQET